MEPYYKPIYFCLEFFTSNGILSYESMMISKMIQNNHISTKWSKICGLIRYRSTLRLQMFLRKYSALKDITTISPDVFDRHRWLKKSQKCQKYQTCMSQHDIYMYMKKSTIRDMFNIRDVGSTVSERIQGWIAGISPPILYLSILG